MAVATSSPAVNVGMAATVGAGVGETVGDGVAGSVGEALGDGRIVGDGVRSGGNVHPARTSEKPTIGSARRWLLPTPTG
jgi:hypothetical protein